MSADSMRVYSIVLQTDGKMSSSPTPIHSPKTHIQEIWDGLRIREFGGLVCRLTGEAIP